MLFLSRGWTWKIFWQAAMADSEKWLLSQMGTSISTKCIEWKMLLFLEPKKAKVACKNLTCLTGRLRTFKVKSLREDPIKGRHKFQTFSNTFGHSLIFDVRNNTLSKDGIKFHLFSGWTVCNSISLFLGLNFTIFEVNLIEVTLARVKIYPKRRWKNTPKKSEMMHP